MSYQFMLSQMSIDNPSAPIFQLTLRRTHLLEDTFRQLEAADEDALRRELVVKTSALVITALHQSAIKCWIQLIFEPFKETPPKEVMSCQ